MNFQFETKVTKELILSRFSEEQIMEYYLKVPIKHGLFRSPLRRDKQPTCSFYRNSSGYLIFKDFATGQHLNVFGVVEALFSCNYYEALKIIANDFGLIKDNSITRNPGKINENPIKIEDKEMSKIQVEIQDFTDLELKWWKKYGITLDILKKFDVYSCKHVFLNDQLFAKSQQHCPIYGYYGKKYQGLELWRIYFPKRTSFRFITNWSTKKIQGYDQLPKKGKLLVITKAMKDVMCLYSMGITAIAPNSETQFISDTVLKDLEERFENIIVLFDNDYTGITFMSKLKRLHPELIYTWIPRSYGSKDISDYYKDHGRKETLNLIKNFVLWLKEHRKN
jgi:hypothetical protein